MSTNHCSKESNKTKSEIIAEDKESTVIQISDENGSYTMTVHQVFPGIQLVYSAAHIQSVLFEERKTTSDNIFEISHCREGRLECNIHDEFCYLTPGDLAVAQTNSISTASYFPLRHYHGITVRIDLDNTPKCLSCLIDDVTVQPKAIAEKFCGEKGGFIARAKPSFEHIFSELYSVPAAIQKGYFKIKILELFLFLSVLDPEQDEFYDRTYTKAQVDLAKNISQYLTEHMDNRITLEQLSKEFHVSGTYIKNSFKAVYGVSMYSYVRTQKMQAAALMLVNTDCTVLEIAGKFGYDNASKFASAFKSVMGMTPNEYRNNCPNGV